MSRQTLSWDRCHAQTLRVTFLVPRACRPAHAACSSTLGHFSLSVVRLAVLPETPSELRIMLNQEIRMATVQRTGATIIRECFRFSLISSSEWSEPRLPFLQIMNSHSPPKPPSKRYLSSLVLEAFEQIRKQLVPTLECLGKSP